jgi:carboxylate-amine ligase
MEFKGSPSTSVGMEFELQLLNPKTGDLTDGILPLMTHYPASPWIQPEYNQATVEIKSRVCANTDEVAVHLYEVLNTLQRRCQPLSIALCGAGTHPFCDRPVRITPTARYLRHSQQAGYLSQWITFALHVHVGIPTGDAAVQVMRQLKPYLPVLLALSANSPLWRCCDTSFASFRQRLLATRHAYGIPPTFQNWQHFVRFFQQAQAANMFGTIHDIHWDLRLQPDLGTIEVRVMDAPSTLREALILTSLVRVLVKQLQTCCCQSGATKELLQPQHWWFERENYFQASRLGLAAIYIESTNRQQSSRPIAGIARDLVTWLYPTAVALGEAPYFGLIQPYLLEERGYERQRRILQEAGEPKLVMDALINLLRDDRITSPCNAQLRAC